MAVYNANLQRIASGDTLAASLVPFAVWLDGSFSLDRFSPEVRAHPRAFVMKDGQAYSAYPIAAPLLVAPLYLPAALMVRAGGWDAERIAILAGILEKLSASIVAALSVVLFYCLARRLAGQRRAIIVALAYAFATETWTISSQALWQHGPSELTVIAGLFFLMRAGEQPARRSALLLAGLCGAVAAAVRPTNILFLGAVYIALAWGRRRPSELALVSVFPVLVGAAVLAYNLHVFGRLAGGYGSDFDAPFWQGFTGLLASPGRGLLIYTPVAAFSLLGALIWLRNRGLPHAPIYLVSVLFSISQILLMSKWRIWWGGHCYGPRLLADIIPCLMVLIVPAMEMISRAAVARLLFGLALLVSTLLQATGAFCYPHSYWDETPVTVGDRPARLWDWKDSPITRSLSVGPRLGPDPRFFKRIRQVF